MSTLETKIPNLDTQKRIASALENLAGTVVSDAIKAYVDEQIKAKRLESRPVGYVWVSFDSTNPGTIVGGTWELVEQGRMLLSAGSDYSVGSTGGEAAHTLTIDEMPTHGHNSNNYTDGFMAHKSAFSGTWNDDERLAVATDSKSVIWVSQNPPQTGGGGSHNNMPPYIAVYMFRRTA
jgi:hypothetical protein